MINQFSIKIKHLDKTKTHQLFSKRKIMKKILFSAILSLSFIFLAGVSSEINAQTINGFNRHGQTRRFGKSDDCDGHSGRFARQFKSSGQRICDSDGCQSQRIRRKSRFGIVYPRGKNRKLSFSEDTINVYEGRAVFTFNVAVPAKFQRQCVIKVPVRFAFRLAPTKFVIRRKTKKSL